MTHLPTLGLLALTDGRLMGDIGDVYEVVSFLIGRSAYTHELPKYGEPARALIAARFPDMVKWQEEHWQDVRNYALAMYGDEVEVPIEWAGSLADGKGSIANIAEAMDRAKARQ